jgi:hypothetical protein
MPILLEAEIWRDGGSLSAVVKNDYGETFSHWLQTTHWGHPRKASHSNLFVSTGSRPELRTRKVEISSDEERLILELLKAKASSITDCDEGGRAHFASALSILHARNDLNPN